jgi:hypothetical protein
MRIPIMAFVAIVLYGVNSISRANVRGLAPAFN